MTPKRSALRPRKRPRQSRAVVTVGAVIEAAARILEGQGVDALTTNRIAEVAGVSIGSVYQYFPNKAAVVAALIEHYIDSLFVAFRAVLAASSESPIAAVTQTLLRGMAGVYGQQARIHAQLYQQMSALGLAVLLDRRLADYARELESFLRMRSDVNVRDPATAALIITHAADGAARALAMREASHEDTERYINELSAMLTGYVSHAAPSMRAGLATTDR